MPTILGIEGSSPRDFCMLERNFLSHLRLALLLALFASAVLLQVRLPLDSSDPDESGAGDNGPQGEVVVLASVGIGAAILVILAGYGEYELGWRDIRSLHPSLQSSKPHLFLISIIVIIVVVTCILLLVVPNQVGLPQPK